MIPQPSKTKTLIHTITTTCLLFSTTQTSGFLHSNVHPGTHFFSQPLAFPNDIRQTNPLYALRNDDLNNNQDGNGFQRFVEKAQDIISPDWSNNSRETYVRPTKPRTERRNQKRDQSLSDMFDVRYSDNNLNTKPRGEIVQSQPRRRTTERAIQQRNMPRRDPPRTNQNRMQQRSAQRSAQRTSKDWLNTNMGLQNRSLRASKDIFNEIENVQVQGGTLKTCSFGEDVERVTVLMKTQGGPLYAKVELWRGPSIPQTMAIYLEDGSINPFRAVIETPSTTNTIAIRNTASMEFPLTTAVEADTIGDEIQGAGFDYDDYTAMCQGNSNVAKTYDANVQSVLLTLRSEGRPIEAKVELLQGPGTNRQEMTVFSENGKIFPFNCIIDSPGPECTVRVINSGSIELPLYVAMKPYIVGQDSGYMYSTAPLTSTIGDEIPFNSFR